MGDGYGKLKRKFNISEKEQGVQQEGKFELPVELRKALKEFKIVAYCWTCAQILYASEKDDQITARVSNIIQTGHYDNFTKEHDVVEFPDFVM